MGDLAGRGLVDPHHVRGAHGDSRASIDNSPREPAGGDPGIPTRARESPAAHFSAGEGWLAVVAGCPETIVSAAAGKSVKRHQYDQQEKEVAQRIPGAPPD